MRAPEVIAGRYRVERPIGQGGMGTVWLCTDEVLGRDVAVKQVGLLPGESAPDLARALREARSSAALNHPHVVAVFDAVEDEDDRLWLVMEHVPGSTLAEIVRAEGRLEPRRVAAIGAQVAGGLAAAHARGTVHRDVKPGNVLVDGATAKISDFGIARTEGDAQLTRSGLLIGTPLFFSPELARGAEPAASADVWALGATLYAAVEGRLPVEDRGNPIATLTAIATATVPRPERAGPLTPVLARMLDPNPSQRCTMAEAAEALGAIADQHRTESLETAEPSGPATVALAAPVAPVTSGAGDVDERRRRPWLLVAVALVLLLAAGGVALGLVSTQEDDPVAGGTTPSPGSSSEPSGTRSPSPSASTSPSTSSAPAEPGSSAASSAPSTSGAEAVPVAAEGPEALVGDYYALLPGDTRSAWSMLGDGARADAGGYGSYAGFWDTIDSVAVEGTSLGEDGVVTVELVYDGAESESRRLLVERSGDGWVISDDLGPA